MTNEQLFIKFLAHIEKKLEYKKHIDKVCIYKPRETKKHYVFDIDIFENNGNFQHLTIYLLRGNVIKSNKLIKNILLSL